MQQFLFLVNLFTLTFTSNRFFFQDFSVLKKLRAKYVFKWQRGEIMKCFAFCVNRLEQIKVPSLC